MRRRRRRMRWGGASISSGLIWMWSHVGSSIHFKHAVIIMTHLQARVPILPMSHNAEWLWKGGFLWAYIGIGSTSNWPKAHLHSGKVIMGLFGGTLNEKVIALWLNSAHRSADATRWLFYWVWYGRFVCMIIHLPNTFWIANLLAVPLVSRYPFLHDNVFIASYFILATGEICKWS